MDKPLYYILQQYSPDSKKCINVFYVENKDKQECIFGKPEKATRFNTIGDAIKKSVYISTDNEGVYFKAIPIYSEPTTKFNI